MSKRIIAVGVAGVIAIATLSIVLPANAQMDRRGEYGPGMMHGKAMIPA